MKKIIFVVIGLIIFTFIGYIEIIKDYEKIPNKNIVGDEKTAEEYVKSHGYEITKYKGEIDKYTLEKGMLYGRTENIPYQQSWGVQKVEPEKYFGKQITIFGFTVKNHPLEKTHKDSKGANVYIMISEGNIIGGYSYPNDQSVGAYDSIDGKTLEEVNGLSYKQWCEDWKKKYGN